MASYIRTAWDSRKTPSEKRGFAYQFKKSLNDLREVIFLTRPALISANERAKLDKKTELKNFVSSPATGIMALRIFIYIDVI